MQLLRDFWASIPPEHRVWVIAAVVVGVGWIAWLGLLMPLLEWWRA